MSELTDSGHKYEGKKSKKANVVSNLFFKNGPQRAVPWLVHSPRVERSGSPLAPAGRSAHKWTGRPGERLCAKLFRVALKDQSSRLVLVRKPAAEGAHSYKLQTYKYV